MNIRILKYLDKISYLIFLLLLDVTFLICRLLPLIYAPGNEKKRKGDLILFPYAFTGSDGYIRRFEEYIPFLTKNKVAFKICNLFSDAYANRQFTGSMSRQYFFYIRILWKRIPQVLTARKYHAAFVQRGLFPVYFDLEFPHLERLLYRLNPHITIDFWDSVFERQADLTMESTRFTHQLSLSNEFLMDSFSYFQGKKVLWKIAVNLDKYSRKTNYNTSQKVRLFWTGLPHNLSFLERYLPLLLDITALYPIQLVLVCQQNLKCEGLDIEHHTWDSATFFTLLQTADIGIYPEFNSVVSKGKSTMKVMDYLATGLPMIGVPYGLPAEALDGRDLLVAHDYVEWKEKLLLLIKDEPLRKAIGTSGRQCIENHYTLDRSYQTFSSFVFHPSFPKPCAE